MTELKKPVIRRTETIIRDRGRARSLVVSMLPGDVLGLRPLGTRKTEYVTFDSCYWLAIKQRVCRERIERKSAKKVSRKGRK